MTWKETERCACKDLAGDNPSQFQRILLDSEEFLLCSQTRHVMKKVKNKVLENRHNKLSEIWRKVLTFMQFHNPEECFSNFYP